MSSGGVWHRHQQRQVDCEGSGLIPHAVWPLDSQIDYRWTRQTCPYCGREFSLTRAGRFRKHRGEAGQ